MDSTKSDGTSADDAKIKSDLFNLVENLRIELQKKDQKLLEKDDELAKEKQEKQVCTFTQVCMCINKCRFYRNCRPIWIRKKLEQIEPTNWKRN
jgi:hypothetical protein